MKAIEVTVNGTSRHVVTEADATLLAVLRDELDLTGTKYGCGEGQCGACTVLVDGRPVRSCSTPVGSIVGKHVTTIEGLAREGALHPLQEAFLAEGAMQCGYCVPGMIMSGAGLLASNPHPTREEIHRGMEGNVCRCGTYQRIIAAIERAAGTVTARKGGAA
jgi:isoquinoline 1-oxidoreductase alpha subunit